MKFQEMRWAGDLLVSCTIDGKPAIFRTPLEKMVQDQLDDTFSGELLNMLPFGIGKSINYALEYRKVTKRLELIEGYYDKEKKSSLQGAFI